MSVPGLRAGGGQSVGAVLRAERPVAHRPHVPVLAGRLHRPLHLLHRPQPQVAGARGQDQQSQRVPHIRRIQVSSSTLTRFYQTD